MTKSFDEWYGKKGEKLHIYRDEKWIAKHGFEAGQQSKQAEIDELQKRIDEAIAILSSKKKMYVDMVIEVEKALKGGNK